MSDETVPAPSPDEGTVATPETSDATPTPENQEPVAEAQTEQTAETEQEDTSESEEDEQPRKKSKSSGYARLKARHQAVLAELDRLRTDFAQPSRGEQKQEVKPPKLEDFNGDYEAYQAAHTEFVINKAVESQFSRFRDEDRKQRETLNKREQVTEFFERTEEVKETLPGFDEAVNSLYSQVGPLKDGLRDLIAESDKGPLILYHLAKNPGLAREVNAFGPIDQAREIGRLEAQLSLPKPKTSTKAPPPMKPIKGGAAPPVDLHALAKKEDATDFIREMRRREAARQGA